MAALLLSMILAAPADGRHWSEKHGVGLRVPDSWTILARDDGERAFVFEGPRLGPGVPRAVLWNGGAASEATLEQFTERLAERIRARPGWHITSTSRRDKDGFAAVRIAIRFAEGDAKGRARFTVALLGGSFYVLEMSAAASHFPGAAFDRLERSLAVPAREEDFGGLVLDAPAGWKREQDRLTGPALGVGASVLRVWRDEGGLRGPEGAAEAAAVEFLGARRATLEADREGGEGRPALRMRVVHAGGWSAMLLAPRAAWDDVLPAALGMLRSARVPAPEPPRPPASPNDR